MSLAPRASPRCPSLRVRSVPGGMSDGCWRIRRRIQPVLRRPSPVWSRHARVKTGLLATEDPKTGRPVICTSQWPVMVQDAASSPVPSARFMVKYLHLDEKGSDVNVASHLLSDVLGGEVEAAVVVSNDSDLSYPIRRARDLVPVGLVNPHGGRFAGALSAPKTAGVGNHWFRQLFRNDFTSHQLPAAVAGYRRPMGW